MLNLSLPGMFPLARAIHWLGKYRPLTLYRLGAPVPVSRPHIRKTDNREEIADFRFKYRSNCQWRRPQH
jgi:hypothetical protein